MTLSERKDYRLGALAAGVVRAFDKKIGAWNVDELGPESPRPEDRIKVVKSFIAGGGWLASLDVREFQPVLDAVAALDQWNTAPLLVAGTEYSVFQAAAAPVAAARINKVVVWFKVGVETAAFPVSWLIHRKNAIAGTVIARFDLEQLVNEETPVGYFSEPVIWDPDMAYVMNVTARIATGVLARVQPTAFVFETAGRTSQ
ncbi:MAG: hypothetical protein Q8S53_15870 [Brevundimonas sp.]|uniref:hypothetical protein n=1 Tax=Brevundimonas sp. TaxID=1871086 RepID=UPI002734D507|nr:hypothetical protein [Brevundimonas sp.]MDP3379843.1 hypothetical protein [Brevundimonas sp.]